MYGPRRRPRRGKRRSRESSRLEEALQYAVDHYPTIKAALEQVNASVAGISVAKAGYLPRLDALWQIESRHRQQHLRPVAAAVGHPGDLRAPRCRPPPAAASGAAPPARCSHGSRSTSAFAARRCASAEAAVVRARADEALTRLDVQSAVGAAFLAVVAARTGRRRRTRPTWSAATCSRARLHTLADNQLRPGAEASRADAERAAAQTRAIQARQALVLAQTTLARVLGRDDGPGHGRRGVSLLAALPAAARRADAASTHPLAQARQAAVDVARAQEDVLARTDPAAPLPAIERLRARQRRECRRLARWGRRRPGARPRELGGGRPGGLSQSVRSREPARAPSRRRRPRRARRRRATTRPLLTVTSQQQAAAAMVDAARAVAANTPVQLAAAQQSEAQARARYRGRPGQHRRSGGRAEPAGAGGVSGCARTGRGLAGAAGGSRRARRPDAVRESRRGRREEPARPCG